MTGMFTNFRTTGVDFLRSKYGLLTGVAICVLAICGLVMPGFFPAFAGFLLTFVEGLILPALFVIVGLYVWAGVSYLVLRFVRPETESRMRDFLKSFPKKWDFFPLRFARHQPPVTEETLRETVSGGWPLACFALMGLSLGHGDWTYSNVLTAIGLLFFGGHIKARGWYGLRCFRLLEIDSYSEPTASTG